MDAYFVSFSNRQRDRFSKSKRCGTSRQLHSETLEARHLLAADVLWISEFMASNSSTLRSDDREYHDWIEIHNPNEETVSLEGWYLTDDSDNLNKWQFPITEIAGDDYLVVFASNQNLTDPAEELHTNFRLASEGDYLALVRPDSSVSHAFSPRYPDQRTDVSYGSLFDENGIRPADRFYFETPTPGEVNGESEISSIVEPVGVSVSRGYYDAPFDVSLSVGTPNATIRYTTDGTWPSPENGIVATGPVTISTTTTFRAGAFAENRLASDVVTQTYIFLDDVLQQTGEGLPEQWGYFDDQGPPRPARADANYGVDPDIVNHAEYKDTIKDDLRAVPTISLVVDPEDLWDLDNGIYSNPEVKGDRWERQSSAEWLNVDGDTEWSTNAGIRIHGGWARRFSQTKKLSFKLIFRGEYGDSNLRYPLFGDDGQQEFQSIILRGGFNDSWRSSGNTDNTYTQDQWTRRTQREMGGFSPRDQYVHLYLNGLYWGMYSATERMNGEWASAYMGGEPEEWDVINTGGSVVDGNTREWSRLMRTVTRDPTFESISEVLDIDDFIDYLIVNQYVGNWDWPHNNWYASRHRAEGAKWRFHSWDAEAAFQRGVAENRVNAIPPAVGPANVYVALREMPEFQELYANRLYEHLFNDGLLTPEANSERLRSIASQMDRAIVGESARWGDGKDDTGRPITRDNWTRRIDRIISGYFPARTDRLLDQFRRENLYPELEGPVFNQFGGPVTPDFDILVTTDVVGGTVLYTDDGTDPRNSDGSIGDTAIRLTASDLITSDSPAKILVPTGDASETDWRNPDFNDASWTDGTATIGYDTGDIDDPISVLDGFTVREIRSTERLNSLDDVDLLLAGQNIEGDETITVPFLDFLDGRRGGNFDNNFEFPNAGNDFATVSTGTIVVHDPGEYTFVISSNDASRLTVDGNLIYADEGRHGTEHRYVTMDLSAGEHPVEIVHFDRSGTSVLEFGFSRGMKTEFDETFQLVGDVKNRPYGDIVQTDLKDQLFGNASTAYARIPFQVDDPTNVGSLLLRPFYDDGFAAYLNGTLVASASAPAELSHASAATVSRFDSDAVRQDLFDITEHKELLRQGENMLAVQALNSSSNDSDMLFSTDLIMSLAHAPINVDQSTNIQARVYLDGEWSALANAVFTVSDAASSDNLRISEINYHPSSATLSEIEAGVTDADSFEFIELVNISDRAVDLSDVSLAQIVVDQRTEGVAFDFSDSPIQELAPGEHVLVVEDLAAFQVRYGEDLPVAGQWMGALSNISETISLLAGETVIQRFTYSDSWYGLSDGRGSSIEVYAPGTKPSESWSNEATWRASVFAGTPGTAGGIMAGDSNRDGVFDSSDLLLVFQAGEYEDDIDGNSTFEEGDWNGDGDFSSSDFVIAFMEGNYRGGDLAIPAVASAFEDVDDEKEKVKKTALKSDGFRDVVFENWT